MQEFSVKRVRTVKRALILIWTDRETETTETFINEQKISFLRCRKKLGSTRRRARMPYFIRYFNTVLVHSNIPPIHRSVSMAISFSWYIYDEKPYRAVYLVENPRINRRKLRNSNEVFDVNREFLSKERSVQSETVMPARYV